MAYMFAHTERKKVFIHSFTKPTRKPHKMSKVRVFSCGLCERKAHVLYCTDKIKYIEFLTNNQ